MSNKRLIIELPVVESSGKHYLSPHFEHSPYFAIVEVYDDMYRVLKIIENPYARYKHSRSHLIDLIASSNIEAAIAMGMGAGAFNLLSKARYEYILCPRGQRPHTTQRSS